jgi:1,4-dihydroxy-2-naphthoate octaprenyltransferase
VLIASLAWLTLLALIISGVLPVLASIAALPVLLSIKAARILLQHADTPQQLAPAIQMTILAMLAHGALLTLALVMASFMAV